MSYTNSKDNHIILLILLLLLLILFALLGVSFSYVIYLIYCSMRHPSQPTSGNNVYNDWLNHCNLLFYTFSFALFLCG